MNDTTQNASAIAEEEEKMRRLRLIVDGAAHRLMHGRCSPEVAERIIAQARIQTLELFPDRGELFDLIYVPRFRRLLEDWG